MKCFKKLQNMQFFRVCLMILNKLTKLNTFNWLFIILFYLPKFYIPLLWLILVKYSWIIIYARSNIIMTHRCTIDDSINITNGYRLRDIDESPKMTRYNRTETIFIGIELNFRLVFVYFYLSPRHCRRSALRRPAATADAMIMTREDVSQKTYELCRSQDGRYFCYTVEQRWI